MVSTGIFKVYTNTAQETLKSIIFSTSTSIIFFFFLFLLFFQVYTFDYYQRDEIKIVFIAFFTLLLLWKSTLYYFYNYPGRKGYIKQNVVILGHNNKALELRDYFLNDPKAGFNFKGMFSTTNCEHPEITGTYDQLEDFVTNQGVNEIFILMGEMHKNLSDVLKSIMSKHPIQIRYIPDLPMFSHHSIKLTGYNNVPVIQIQQSPLDVWYNRLMKRILDVIFSLTAIMLVLSWLIPILYLIDLFTGKQGVFFIQSRSGVNNKTFGCIKFRTMDHNSDSELKQATKNDPRITRIGSFLRKTSIDELPQFFNVLLGDMTIIGPRPHMLMHTEKYKSVVERFMVRHTVKPGITGFAQTRGYRGEIKTINDIRNRIRLDILYIENWSVWLDLLIAYKTMTVLITGDKKAY